MRDKLPTALAEAMAEQAYMMRLLVKTLVEKKVLQPGEIESRYALSGPEKPAFFQEFLNHLVSIGLRID